MAEEYRWIIVLVAVMSIMAFWLGSLNLWYIISLRNNVKDLLGKISDKIDIVKEGQVDDFLGIYTNHSDLDEYIEENVIPEEIVAEGAVFQPTGEAVKSGFPRIYKGYTLYDFQVECLLLGEEVRIRSNDGEDLFIKLFKDVKGEFTLAPGIPIKTFSHRWRMEERKALYEGQALLIEDFWDKQSAEMYKAFAKWDNQKAELIIERVK